MIVRMNEREHKGPTRPVTTQQNERLHYIWLHLVVTDWIDLSETILLATQGAFVGATLIKWKNVFFLNYFTLKQKVNVICLTILWKFKRSKRKQTILWSPCVEKRKREASTQGKVGEPQIWPGLKFLGGKCKLNLYQFCPACIFADPEIH